MAGSNKGLIAVLAGGASLGLGAGLFYLFVWTPKQDLKRAQSEVQEFSDAWKTARDCLLEGGPELADGEQAYLATEVTGVDEDHLATCDAYLYDMKREGDYSSGDPELEGAWQDTRPALRNLAKYVGYRVAPEKPASLDRIGRELAAAIGEMDRRESALRIEADLLPVERPGKVLPRLPGSPLADPGAGGFEFVSASSNRVSYRLHGDTADRQIRQQGLAEKDVLPINGQVFVGADGSWGLWLTRDGALVEFGSAGEGPAELRAGPVDVEGLPAGDGVLVAEASKSVYYVPVAAFGRGAERAVVYRAESTSAPVETVARTSNDSGTTWSAGVVVPEYLSSDLYDFSLERYDFFGRESPAAPLRWLSVRPGSSLDATQVVPASLAGQSASSSACFSGDSAFWLLDNAFYMQKGTAPATPIPGATVTETYDERLACSASAMAFVSRSGSDLKAMLCDSSTCTRWSLELAGAAQHDIVVADKVAYLVIFSSPLFITYRLDMATEELSPRFPGQIEIDEADEEFVSAALEGVVFWQDTLYALVGSGGWTEIMKLGTGE